MRRELEQLAGDIEATGHSERRWSDVRWFVEIPVAQRGLAAWGHVG